jgi:signal transduction histidine kinase
MHADIADVIADTALNSIEAGSSLVELRLEESAETIAVEISDNGKGMDEKTLGRVFDPFFTEAGKHDRRRVGLGLPILKQMCEALGGNVEIESAPGKGTRLRYSFSARHIDLPPMGDISKAVLQLMSYPGDFEFRLLRRKGDGGYEIYRSELVEAVGPLESVDALQMAREFLASQEEELG